MSLSIWVGLRCNQGKSTTTTRKIPAENWARHMHRKALKKSQSDRVSPPVAYIRVSKCQVNPFGSLKRLFHPHLWKAENCSWHFSSAVIKLSRYQFSLSFSVSSEKKNEIVSKHLISCQGGNEALLRATTKEWKFSGLPSESELIRVIALPQFCLFVARNRETRRGVNFGRRKNWNEWIGDKLRSNTREP